MIRDTSAQKTLKHASRTAKESAENVSKFKSEFLANVSHEIRTRDTGIGTKSSPSLKKPSSACWTSGGPSAPALLDHGFDGVE